MSAQTTLGKSFKSIESFVKNIATNMNKLSLDDAHYFESNQKLEDIKKLIDNDADTQKMEGMKRLIAQISKTRCIIFIPCSCQECHFQKCGVEEIGVYVLSSLRRSRARFCTPSDQHFPKGFDSIKSMDKSKRIASYVKY